MKDPAVGRSRAERALGEHTPKKKTKKVAPKKPRNTESNVRNENVGQYAGPKPTYGRYNVSEQAQDVLNRSLNKKTR